MRVIKMLGATLIGFAAFIGVSANAQQVPVSCNLVLISSDGPPNGSSRYITHQCKESNGNAVASRALVWTQATNGYTSCTISTQADITWTGTCLSPSFFRTTTPPPACTSINVQVQGGCANSYDSSMLTNPTIVARCGSGCSLEYRTIGWTSLCPNSGSGRSPEYGLFCK